MFFRPCFHSGTWACTVLIKGPLIATCLMLFILRQAGAASVPDGFVDTQVAGGLNSPTAVTVLPDRRVLVVQQNGIIRIIKDDSMLSANFHTVQKVDSYAERGCLGITNDPAFAANHWVYIYCTITDGKNSFNRILRVTEANDKAVAGSEQAILTLPDVPPGTQWHMGGALRFGTDGKLYVAVGNHEDTKQPAASSNSQNLSNPFGKILRINADGTIPPDNPYVNTPGAYPANFNLGLRNPFTFDIRRNPNPHVGFGGTGAHYCVGANLARMTIELIFDAIADHVPDLAPLAKPERLRSGWLNGIKHWEVDYGQGSGRCPVAH